MSNGIHLINNQGVKSLQNGDYNTYYALAEIIDNSIAAKAYNIHIIGIQKKDSSNKRGHNRLCEVVIYDDGTGMTKDVASLCLQLGGGTHIGAKKGLSKFGMGLPQASGSQSMRTEVYTWQKKNEYLYTYLDFDELEKNDPPVLPLPELQSSLPPQLKNVLAAVTKEKGIDPFSEKQGTIVYWRNATRLNHKTFNAFNRNIEEFIGRVYRKFIHNDKCSIMVSGFERLDKSCIPIPGSIIAKKIRINDPLFLLKNNIIGDHDSRFENSPTNLEHGKEITKINCGSKVYNVRVKFSLINPEVLIHLGSSPGGTPLGKLYGRNIGISLVRSGRELKLSDFGFIGDWSKVVNRYWSAEVDFEPELDNLFGVTFDKQEARLFRKISKAEYTEDLDESDDDSLQLMYELSQKLESNIKTMQNTYEIYAKGTRTPTLSKCPTCGEKKVAENKCNSCGFVLKSCAKHTDQLIDSNGMCPVCTLEGANPVEDSLCTKHNKPLKDGRCPLCDQENEGGKVIEEKDEKRLRQYLEDNFSNYKGNQSLLDRAIEYLKDCGKNHIMVYTLGDKNSFITHNSYGQLTIISVNMNHPFYDKYMHEIIDDVSRDIRDLVPIHLLIGAMVNAEQQDYHNQEVLEDYRGSFAINLKKLMREFSLK